MKQVLTHTTTTLEIKQSKFIAHLVPYSAYIELLENLREEHPKARHFVKAFRYLNEHNQIVEGSSDDGEPKGTSGKPSLAVLSGNELINVGVIIVRYFGGTKLGTGGLVRAYSDAVNLVIESSELVVYLKEIESHFTCNYSDLSRVEYELHKQGLHVKDKTFENDVSIRVSATQECLDGFYKSVGRLVTQHSLQ